MVRLLLSFTTLFLFFEGSLLAQNDLSCRWSFSLSSEKGHATVTTLSLSPNGTFYVTGRIDGDADFDPLLGETLIGDPGGDAYYVARYSSEGELLRAEGLWDKSGQDSGYLENPKLSIDRSGNIYLMGYVQGVFDFDFGHLEKKVGKPIVLDVRNETLYIAKYSPDFSLLWVNQFDYKYWKPFPTTSPGFPSFSSIAFDGENNFYVRGHYHGSLDIDPSADSLLLERIDKKYTKDSVGIFVAKFSPEGNLLWAKSTARRTEKGHFDLMIPQSSDCIYMYGSNSGKLDVDFSTDSVFTSNNNVFDSDDDMLLVKYDIDMNIIWWHSYLNNGISSDIRYLKEYSDGGVALQGSFRGTLDFDPGPDSVIRKAPGNFGSSLFIARFNEDGKFIHVVDVYSSSSAISQSGFGMDKSGNMYSMGSMYEGVADFDPGPEELRLGGNNSPNAMYIVKYDGNGNIIYGKSIGTYNYCLAGDVDDNGAIYVAGTFTGTKKLDLDPGSDSNFVGPAGSGSTDVYAARYDQITSKIDEAISSKIFDIHMYPNPTIDELNVFFNPTFRPTYCTVHDLLGKTHKSIAIPNEALSVTINVRDLHTGTYIVRFFDKYHSSSAIPFLKH
jgi:hypothetical protein